MGAAAEAWPQDPAAAIEALLPLHWHHLCQLACQVTHDAHLAEDAAQEAFIRAWQSWPEFQGRSSARTWLTRITVRQAIDLRRRGRWRETSTEVLPEVPSAGAEEEAVSRMDLTASLGRLPPATQQLLAGLAAGYEYNALAAALGLPIGTVRSRIHRARAALREAAGAHEGRDAVALNPQRTHAPA